MGNLMLLTEMSAYSNAVQQYGKDAADFYSRRDRFCFNLQIKEKEIEHINKHYPFDI